MVIEIILNIYYLQEREAKMKDNDIDISKERLKNSYHILRKVCDMEEKYLFKKHILLATQRVLDVRDARNMISKTKNKELQTLIDEQYLIAVNDLMDIVYSILNEPPFCFIFENDIELDDYIVLEFEDMVLVNGYLQELKPYNSRSINIDMIFIALNEAIFDYISCIKNEEEYSDGFDDDYVQITDEQEEEDE